MLLKEDPQTSEVGKVTRPGLRRLCATIREIRDRVGLPCYCYDWPTLETTVHFLLATAGDTGLNFRFYLAFFALPNISLFKRLMGLDSRLGINCNTREEILALEGAGWTDWDRVSFSGGVIPQREMLAVARMGCVVNAASPGNLAVLLESDTAAKIGLRLDFTNTALKGIRLSELDACFRQAEEKGKRITALHAYPGTEIEELDTLIRHAEILIEVAARHTYVEELNFGGGFWFNYNHPTGIVSGMIDLPRYFTAVQTALATRLHGRRVRVSWEPGRIVFAGAGFFVAEVTEVRVTGMRAADVHVDASFTQVPAPKIRGRQHKAVVLDSQGKLKKGPKYEARLCGATTLSTDQLLPRPILIPEVEAGDLIVILDVGAYGRAGSYNFLGKTQPPEILLENTGWRLVRQRQRADHLLEGYGDVAGD